MIRYYDAQTDDALLTRAVVDSARYAWAANWRCRRNFAAATLTEDGVDRDL